MLVCESSTKKKLSGSQACLLSDDSFDLLLILANKNIDPLVRDSAYHNISIRFKNSIIASLTDKFQNHCKFKNKDLVTDAWHDCIAKLWQGNQQIDRRASDNSAFNFLYTITHRKILDKIRQTSRREKHLPTDFITDRIADSRPAPDVLIRRSEAIESVKIALSRLPADQAEVLSAVYIDDIKYRELASKLGVSLGIVQGRGKRGLARIREILTQQAA